MNQSKTHDILSRTNPERPILGVGGVILRGEEVLLVQRANDPWKGYWSIPGGVVHTGELLKDAVIREMREETGLEVDPIEVVEVFESISDLFHYVVIDYLCRVISGTALAGDDALNARWFPVSALPENITPGVPAVIQKAIRAVYELA